jgi:hypothetical protein
MNSQLVQWKQKKFWCPSSTFECVRRQVLNRHYSRLRLAVMSVAVVHAICMITQRRVSYIEEIWVDLFPLTLGLEIEAV